jgi:hypothetical protein
MEIASLGPHEPRFARAIAVVQSIPIAITRAGGASVIFELVSGDTNIMTVVGGDNPVVIDKHIVISLQLVYLFPANSHFSIRANGKSLKSLSEQ